MSASGVLSLIGWAVLPGYATSFLQSLYYGITIRAGDPKPMPQTPRYERHRRRIFILVIVGYLLYTIYETFHQVQVAGNYYTLLDVTPFDSDKTIQSKFRRLAARHHPDKIGNKDGAEAYFMALRQAQETLLDPVQRFAYDRFGTDALKWQLKTTQDYLMTSLYRSVIPGHAFILMVMVSLNWLWWSSWGRYWRFYYFAAMLTLELVLITRPQSIFMPAAYIPEAIRVWLPYQSFHLLPFQVLALNRRISMSLHIFISQVAPPASRGPKTDGGISGQTMQQFVQLVQTARDTDLEATRALQLSQAAFRGDRETVPVLRRGMQEALVLGGVRSSRAVQQAVASVIQRRQEEVNSDQRVSSQ